MVCVPIAPHTIQARAFLTSPSDVVEITMSHDRPSVPAIAVDGQFLNPEGDVEYVAVRRGDADVLLLDYGPEKMCIRDSYKTKDLRTGRVVEQTCNAGSKFESVTLTTTEMQYLYNDGDNYYFMNMETYDQIPVSSDFIGDNAKWLRENDVCQLLYADEDLMGVNPPMFIEAEITETDPGCKGDTVQGGSKPATIDTGAIVQVPMYLNVGERIKVDTRDGKFVSRV